jgi:photoactive yellow protein
MENESSLNLLPFGLLELDTTGTVLYYKPEQWESFDAPPPDMLGRNFFTEITRVAEAGEFQDHIKSFGQGHAPATSFNFTFEYGHRMLLVRVLLARIHEKSGIGKTESLFVHIRLGQYKAAA